MLDESAVHIPVVESASKTRRRPQSIMKLTSKLLSHAALMLAAERKVPQTPMGWRTQVHFIIRADVHRHTYVYKRHQQV